MLCKNVHLVFFLEQIKSVEIFKRPVTFVFKTNYSEVIGVMLVLVLQAYCLEQLVTTW